MSPFNAFLRSARDVLVRGYGQATRAATPPANSNLQDCLNDLGRRLELLELDGGVPDERTADENEALTLLVAKLVELELSPTPLLVGVQSFIALFEAAVAGLAQLSNECSHAFTAAREAGLDIPVTAGAIGDAITNLSVQMKTFSSRCSALQEELDLNESAMDRLLVARRDAGAELFDAVQPANNKDTQLANLHSDLEASRRTIVLLQRELATVARFGKVEITPDDEAVAAQEPEPRHRLTAESLSRPDEEMGLTTITEPVLALPPAATAPAEVHQLDEPDADPTVLWSEARKTVAFNMYTTTAAYWPIDVIVEQVNALPGPPVSRSSLAPIVSKMGGKRSMRQVG